MLNIPDDENSTRLGTNLSEEVIKEFVAAYSREFDYYQVAARLCSQRLDALLAAQGIRAIVTHRAKRPNKLLAKLRQRDRKKNYDNAEKIRNDIADLAGVRIALYFPGDRDRIKSIIENNFQKEHLKSFPEDGGKRKEKRFEGYYADHYRIRLHDSSLDETQKGYAAAKIEIQVGSVLMHAWAEVEHDLVYKPESGELSDDEHAILDELNGLVITGEIALERLQSAVERRLSGENVSFDSHYELAAFLDKWMRKNFQLHDSRIGRVDILWELVRKADLNSATKLGYLLSAIESPQEDEPVSDLITDAVLSENPDLYNAYAELQTNLSAPRLYDQGDASVSRRTESIGRFLSSWIILERTFMLFLKGEELGTRPTFPNMTKLAIQLELSADAVGYIEQARRVRNHLVHGVEIPNQKYLDEVRAELEVTLAEIENHPSEALRAAYQEGRRPLHG